MILPAVRIGLEANNLHTDASSKLSTSSLVQVAKNSEKNGRLAMNAWT